MYAADGGLGGWRDGPTGVGADWAWICETTPHKLIQVGQGESESAYGVGAARYGRDEQRDIPTCAPPRAGITQPP